MSIVLGPLLRVKLKSGGAGGSGVVVVLEPIEVDWIEDAAVVLDDVEVLEDVDALDVAVVLTEGAFCASLG